MEPQPPLVLHAPSAPNFELLRRAGWSLSGISGSYCVAWRGRDEAVFQWRADGWHRVGGRGCGVAA